MGHDQRNEWDDILDDEGPEGRKASGCLRPRTVALLIIFFFGGGMLGLSAFTAAALAVFTTAALSLAMMSKPKKTDDAPEQYDGWSEGPGSGLWPLTPAFLLIIYGLLAVSASWWAQYVVPGSWEWPLPEETRVVVLDNDQRAAATANSGRVQIYDADGRYIRGWFVPDEGGRAAVAGTEGRNTVLVDLPEADKLILYGMNGLILRDDKRPEHFKVEPSDRFQAMTFATPWYQWPLISRNRASALVMVGLLISGGLLATLISLSRLRQETAKAVISNGATSSSMSAVRTAFVERRHQILARSIVGFVAATWLGVLVFCLLGLKRDTNAIVIFVLLTFGLYIWLSIRQMDKDSPQQQGDDETSAPAPGLQSNRPSSEPTVPDLAGQDPRRDRDLKAEPAATSSFSKAISETRPAFSEKINEPDQPAQLKYNRARTDRAVGSTAEAAQARRLSPAVTYILLALWVLAMTYGSLIFVSPWLAHKYVPADWEWPMKPQSRVLRLESGARIGIQHPAQRLQVYDAEGRYRQGWFVGEPFSFLGLAGNPGDFGGLEAVAVQTDSGLKITYDLKGNIVHQVELPDRTPLPESGRFEEMSFSVSPLLLPLVNPLAAWGLLVMGLMSIGVAIGRLKKQARPAAPVERA